jgi:hypothetical protein
VSRADIPQPVRDEMDALLALLMSFAVEALKKDGEFYPFAGVATGKQKPRLIATAGADEKPASADLLADLEAALREQAASGMRAAAIAAEVQVTNPHGEATDAIRVHVEHAEGDAVEVFMPYAKKRLQGVEFGEMFAGLADRLIFT